MIALVQRVARASVDTLDPPRRASIERGLLVLVCAMQGDEDRDVIWMANKLTGLRIFSDTDGRMNRSLRDIDGAMLVVSQFTLAGDCTKGYRPSFTRAAAPAQGEAQYAALVQTLRDTALMDVQTGVFGASMQVELVNDGPVTIWIDSRS